MLKIAYPLYRAVIAVLAVTGMRIGEVLSRKWADLEIREKGYARVRLQPAETKMRYKRYTFLTRECVEWLEACRKPSDYLFPGEEEGHLGYNAVRQMTKPLFQKVGCIDKSDRSEIYTLHSFRTFADSEMSRCGLDRKWIEGILGHVSKLGATASYPDFTECERAWVEKCADKLCFLSNSTEHTEKIEKLQNHNGKLELLLERLLEKLA
jgi:integrase